MGDVEHVASRYAGPGDLMVVGCYGVAMRSTWNGAIDLTVPRGTLVVLLSQPRDSLYNCCFVFAAHTVGWVAFSLLDEAR